MFVIKLTNLLVKLRAGKEVYTVAKFRLFNGYSGMNIYRLTLRRKKAGVNFLHAPSCYLKAQLGENLQVGHVLQHLGIDLSGVQCSQELKTRTEFNTNDLLDHLY